jgi:sec-independent protein translocase protein TatC
MDETNGGKPPGEDYRPPEYPDDPFGARTPDAVFPPAYATAGTGGGAGGGSKSPPSEPPHLLPGDEEEEDDGEGMLRMSFMDHLEELRSRIIRALVGFGVAFFLCIVFAYQLWDFVRAPGDAAFKAIGEGGFIAIDPMEQFSIIWMWTPLVASFFVAAPWVIYQVWAFIAPGLYKRERKWAVPFITCTAGLFITGGLFAYFIAFRYGLTFLLGIGKGSGVAANISIDRYFSLFTNVMLGVAVIFEMPVLIFFLTLIRVASPSFLLRHSRYAILAIVIIAAIITPTPDVFNLMLFAVPMCLLFFLGIFASYLLVLKRENRKFPWKIFFIWLAVVVALLGSFVALAVLKYGYHFVRHWPFLAR